MSTGQVRMRVPDQAKRGEVATVRGRWSRIRWRSCSSRAASRWRRKYNYIHKVEATYNGKKVFEAETTQAVSQNPFVIVFPSRPTRRARWKSSFHDTQGKTYVGQGRDQVLNQKKPDSRPACATAFARPKRRAKEETDA
jgi:hypothetical protein